MSFAQSNSYRASAKAPPPKLRPSAKRNRPQDVAATVGAPLCAPFAWIEPEPSLLRKRHASDNEQVLTDPGPPAAAPAQAAEVAPALLGACEDVTQGDNLCEPEPVTNADTAGSAMWPAANGEQQAASEVAMDDAAHRGLGDSIADIVFAATASADAHVRRTGSEPALLRSTQIALPDPHLASQLAAVPSVDPPFASELAAAGFRAPSRQAVNLLAWEGDPDSQNALAAPAAAAGPRAPCVDEPCRAVVAGRAAPAASPVNLFEWAGETNRKPVDPCARAPKAVAVEAPEGPMHAAGGNSRQALAARSARGNAWSAPWASDPPPSKPPPSGPIQAKPPAGSATPPRTSPAAAPSLVPLPVVLAVAPEAPVSTAATPKSQPSAPACRGLPPPDPRGAAGGAIPPGEVRTVALAARSLLSLFLGPLHRALSPMGSAVSTAQAIAALRGFGASAEAVSVLVPLLTDAVERQLPLDDLLLALIVGGGSSPAPAVRDAATQAAIGFSSAPILPRIAAPPPDGTRAPIAPSRCAAPTSAKAALPSPDGRDDSDQAAVGAVGQRGDAVAVVAALEPSDQNSAAAPPAPAVTAPRPDLGESAASSLSAEPAERVGEHPPAVPHTLASTAVGVARWVPFVDASLDASVSIAGRRSDKDAPPPTEGPQVCGERMKATKQRAGVMWVVSVGQEDEPPTAEAASRCGSIEECKGLPGKANEAENEGPQPGAVSRSRQQPRGIAWVV